MNYDEKSRKVKRIFLPLMLIILLMIVVGGTYAWFSYNRVVDTNKVSASTGTDDIKLLVSTKGGAAFKGKETAAIGQVNKSDAMELIPVSTADLKNYLYSPVTEDGNAYYFSEAKDEQFIYHGRIYIMAKASDEFKGRTMSLYLDGSGKNGTDFVTAEDQRILNASRLGIIADGGKPLIFTVSNKSNDDGSQLRNTYIGDQLVEDGNVIVMKNGEVTPVADPAVNFDKYSVTMSGGSARLPDNSLLTMELNQIYEIDVYFYLEGCDPDCSNQVKLKETDMQLAFFGVLN